MRMCKFLLLFGIAACVIAMLWCETHVRVERYDDGVTGFISYNRTGKLHGISYTYFPSGKMRSVAVHENGLLVSLRQYDEQGNLTMKVYENENYELVQWTNLDEEILRQLENNRDTD